MPPSRRRTCCSASDAGSRFCFGEAILFFPEQLPAPAQRVAVEEAKAEMGDLEGAARDPALTQVKQVGPDLRLAELVWRAPVVLSQLPDRPQVVLLCPLAQPGQDHVLDHPCAQW
jgi:hypothetical protein